LARFCVPRRVWGLLGDPFLAEREADFLNLNAADASFRPLRVRTGISRVPLISFSSCFARRGDTPRILAVSLIVANGDITRTPIASPYIQIRRGGEEIRFREWRGREFEGRAGCRCRRSGLFIEVDDKARCMCRTDGAWRSCASRSPRSRTRLTSGAPPALGKELGRFIV